MNKDTIEVQPVKDEWVYIPIENNGYAIKVKSLHPGHSDRVAELYEYNPEANAAYICKSVNNHEALISALQDVLEELNQVMRGQSKLTFTAAEIKAKEALKNATK